MKTKYSKFITAGLAAAMITPAVALQGPADDAPPPPQGKQETASLPQFKLPPDTQPESKAKEVAKEAPKADVAFLGVVSGPVPKFLIDQLDLKKGEGVIVRAVSPDSPASRAGIAVNDVITEVAGHSVGTQEDLSNQISQNAPETKIDVSVIHKSKTSTLSVVLGVRPAEVAISEPPTLDQLDLDRLPKEMADHIRQALGGKESMLGFTGDVISPQMEDAIREIENRMRSGRAILDDVIPPSAADANAKSSSSATFRMKDNDGSIEVKSKDGSKEVTVKDRQDAVIWSGPWNSEQDRAAAPDIVRNRMGGLNLDTGSSGGGLKFNFNGAGHPAAPDH